LSDDSQKMKESKVSVEDTGFEAKVDGFFSLFEPTIKLAEDMIVRRTNAQEVVLLLCARLDALASCISREESSNRQSFVTLVTNYSGHRDVMESVSAGDMYYELGYHRWLAEGMIPKPGRLTRFSRVNDPIIQLLERSDIPLTAVHAEKLFTRIMAVLTHNFRCRPGQPVRKPMIAKPQFIIEKLLAEFRRSADSDLRRQIEIAVRPLLDSMTIAALLYGKFRNNAVHGIKVQFDEIEFFKHQELYWEPLFSEYYPPFLLAKFPAPLLLQLLRNCATTLKRKMLATRRLPPDVHFHIFGGGVTEHLEYLEARLLPQPSLLRVQLK
jgi:hypothetical protein